MPDDYWDEPRFHPEHLDDNQNSNPGKQRVEPLLKDGDVVDRLKQFRLRWQDSGDLTYLGKALTDAVVEIESLRKAPASPSPEALPASGVEAVGETVAGLPFRWEEIARVAMNSEPWVQCASELRAALDNSTPSEPVGWVGDLTLQRLKNGQEGKIYPTDPCANAAWSMPVYLAKPASEPAGGEVREAFKAGLEAAAEYIERIGYYGHEHHAYEIRCIDLPAALTSAPAPEDRT